MTRSPTNILAEFRDSWIAHARDETVEAMSIEAALAAILRRTPSVPADSLALADWVERDLLGRQTMTEEHFEAKLAEVVRALRGTPSVPERGAIEGWAQRQNFPDDTVWIWSLDQWDGDVRATLIIHDSDPLPGTVSELATSGKLPADPITEGQDNGR